MTGTNEVEQFVNEAWASILQEDEQLRIFRFDVSERSVAHRLAVHLELKFPKWHIDCEYNRVVKGDPKQIKLMKRVATRLAKTVKGRESLVRKLLSGSSLSVYPDIIVHHRGEHGHANNLLVIELKKKSNPEGDHWDTVKLEELTSGAGNYKYQHGLFIEFDVDGIATFRWFADGKQL